MIAHKRQTELITGIDIGSSAIRIAVGQHVYRGDDVEDVQIIGLVEVPSEGVQKGNVTSIEETVSSLSNGLEQIERLTGVPVEHAWIGVSGTHIISQASRGVVAVAKSDGEISDEDVTRVVEAARTIAVPLNYDILHVLPKTFNVDGQIGIKDPIGMTGIRLEAETQIIYGLTSQIKNTTKAVYRTGIDVDDLVLTILAIGDAVTTQRQKELGVAVVDIGSATTGFVIYQEGDIAHTGVIPIGSEHVTNDLAIGLRSSIDIAERVKLEHGHADPRLFKRIDKFDLQQVGAEKSEEVRKQFVAEIVGARIGELLEKINDELATVGAAGQLPSGVIYTGGGAKLSGLVDASREVLALPASLGYPLFVTSGHQRVHDSAFVGASSLVHWGMHAQQDAGGSRSSRFQGTTKMLQKLQGVWKSLIP